VPHTFFGYRELGRISVRITEAMLLGTIERGEGSYGTEIKRDWVWMRMDEMGN